MTELRRASDDNADAEALQMLAKLITKLITSSAIQAFTWIFFPAIKDLTK
jgi:hypothetical protein